jgi:hypothetical protein
MTKIPITYIPSNTVVHLSYELPEPVGRPVVVLRPKHR